MRTRVALFGALVVVSILTLSGTAVAATGNCYSQQGCIEDARSAEAFKASFGVNTHLGYSDTVYWQKWPLVRDRLLELGVSHIRDGTFPASYPEAIGPTVAARYNELGAHGLKGNLLVGHEQAMTPTTVAQRLGWIKNNVAHFTMSIEGSNEFDTQGGDAERVRSLRAMQCEIHQRVKADPVLASKLVVGPSSGNFHSDDIWYGEIGDLSACLDRGNLHPYAGADPPHRRLSRDLSVAIGWAQTTYGQKPLWATETGYVNTADPVGLSEAAAGTYIPRALLENFRRGVERSQAYELIDLQTGSPQALDNYGLLRSDGTRKPAFSALRNLFDIVDDADPASGRLGFGIVCTANCRYGDPDAYPTQDGPIRHVLLKHSSGAYFLAVWSESQVWDAAARRDTPKAPQSLRLYLHEAPAKVEIFDPSTGTTARSSDTSGNRIIETAAPDTVRLIKIMPAAAPVPAPAPAPAPADEPDLPVPLPAPAVATPPSVTTRPIATSAPLAGPDGPGAGASPAPPAPPASPTSLQPCVRSSDVVRITFSKKRYAGIRAHHKRALRKGWPRNLVFNPRGAQRRSDKLLANMPAIPGRKPVSYPPAVGRGRGGRGLTRGTGPAGWRASVAYVPSSESRSFDSTMTAKLSGYCDGTRFRYVFK